ncbi:lactonase family protein [Streptomyces ficellus]|uniref:Lactonase family protein n=1 Tax=Streptomyces ficellus TaxID=1977088 RepID=A0ABT7Z1F5_9ACTN|nr:lactonase family protein [Streptomyces ficellus]MDN3293319.1 lactonase family protein [Streptomyces ficellus]
MGSAEQRGERSGRDGGHWAYIGSFTSGGGRGITVAAVDPATGALTPRTAVDTVVNPACLTLAPDTGVLYAVSETEPGKAAAFRTGDGVLTPLGPAVEVGGCGPTHLSLAGRRLLTANYGSGSVSSLPLAADGSLSGPPAVLAHRGSGPDAERQEGPHAHQVLPDPSGAWVLSVDLGTDSVRVCALDPGSGMPRVHAETVLRAGSGPRHLAFHPDGELVYVLHELEPQLTVCRWDPVSGGLEPLSEVAVEPEGAPEDGRAYPSVVSVSSDGRFVWAAVRGSNTLVTLSLADGAEKPRVTGAVECGGSWPRDLVADRTGRRLYVANEWSGDVTWFDIDPVDGRLRRAGAVEVPAAACVVFS